MYSKLKSRTLTGIDARTIVIETDVSFGFPSFNIVGLPDMVIKESKERVRTAITNSGVQFPDRRVTVNMSPADVRKIGNHFDLPIALGILQSAGLINSQRMSQFAFLGELALDGTINRIKGALPLIIGLRDRGVTSIVIPYGNREEGEMVDGTDVYCASDLREVIRAFDSFEYDGGTLGLEKIKFRKFKGIQADDEPDYADVSGQERAKRAMQITAAAMHNILLVGPPGSGKTMMAKRLPGIMPPLTYDECLEITKIYSIFGKLSDEHQLIVKRPFRSPDHTVSSTALTGGGYRIKAGEVSLAHLGILFLDEIPEFQRSVIESLRRPMEDEKCTIARLTDTMTLPSKFLTVAAMNVES